jgi:thiol-disulfide isomerase/thioredoxin
MRMRWIVAGVGAVALAAVTVSSLWWTRDVEMAGESCAADARTANLSYTLKDLEDREVSLADYRGKVILLDFWATWCGPCKVEIPHFIELQNTYGSDGFQVIGVSVDDTLESLKPYVAEMKMNYPVLQGLGRDDVLDDFGPILGLPTTMLISRDGRICETHAGLTSKETFERGIRALL